MTQPVAIQADPNLDLVLERVIDVPRELVWQALTEPEHLKQWFCPKPWRVSECEVDLRPGGMMRTVMQGPDGEVIPGAGCYLEVIPQERLVWTDALLPGYRPSESPFFTAVLELETVPGGTRYRATAIHRDPESKQKHEEMGFYQGWGTALDQMVELIKSR